MRSVVILMAANSIEPRWPQPDWWDVLGLVIVVGGIVAAVLGWV